MNLVDFVFKILNRFVQMDLEKEVSLKDKAKKWYVSYVLKRGDDADPEVKHNAITGFVAKYGEEWYVQVGLALFYIYAVKAIGEWMNPSVEPEDKL